MKKYMEKVNTLLESLPYIREFYGKTMVIKYGGHAMVDDALQKSFARDMVLLKLTGMNPVIVHGGGPQINDLLKQIGKKSEFVDGMRVTDQETMDVVEMVLVGKINNNIVNNINFMGGKAVGLSGKDGRLITAEKMYHVTAAGEKVDIGLVGSVRAINPSVLETLDRDRFIPVIAPVGVDEEGDHLQHQRRPRGGQDRRGPERGKAHPPHRRGGRAPGGKARVNPEDEAGSGPYREGDDHRRHDPQGQLLHRGGGRRRGQGPHHRRQGGARGAP